MGKNKNKTYQNLLDVVKEVLRRKFIAVNTYIKIEERSKISNLTLHLKNLGKEEQI